jgi:hypothetical protein
MRRDSLLIALLCGCATALASAPAALGGTVTQGPRGYLMVTFSGSGGGGYRSHDPAEGAGAGCREPNTSSTETDSYSWSYTFVVPPAGGSGGAPVGVTGSGQISSTEQAGRCSGSPAASTTCSEQLRPPPAGDSGDLAYPDVNVVVSGREVTVGALGELVADGSPSCTGPGTLVPNLVQGYSQLQASVTFPRAVLYRTGVYSGTFTMDGSGLYDGVALSGQCSSTSCDTANCTQDLPAGGGAPSSCSYGEDYNGTIEVRTLRG